MAVNDPILDGIKKQVQEYSTLPISENSDDKAIYELIASADIDIGETVLTFVSIDIFNNYDIENMKLINRDTLEELSIDSFNLINKTITITEPLTSAVLQNDTFILNNRDHLIIQSMYATENNTEIDDLTRIRERFRFTLKVYGDEMKLNMIDIVNATGAMNGDGGPLQMLMEQQLPAVTAFKVARIAQALTPEVQAFRQSYEALVRKYGVEQDGAITVPPDSKPLFMEELETVLKVEVDINIVQASKWKKEEFQA